MDDVLYFLSTTTTVDAVGDPIVTTTEREVFCQVKSIGQSEFYQAQDVGLKPEIKFVLADHEDYADEKKLKHKSKVYEIIRTYRDGSKLEITCKGDVNVST